MRVLAENAIEPIVGEPVRAGDFEAAVAALDGRNIVTLTGAGISTDSGIPDYRGEGAPRRTPMTFEQFVSSERSRKRYWAGSHLGYGSIGNAEPNAGHRALAQLEEHGIVTAVITQNVDGLHTKAGSRRVVPLHGGLDTVFCLNCGQVFAREDIAAQIDAANPWLKQPDAVTIAPDGDAEVARVDDFEIPVCTVCGGMLKPDVVFFGELIPVERFAQAQTLVRDSDALLVAGSSLAVNSGIRVVELARRRNLPIVVVNRGPTKGDSSASVKLDAGTSQTLSALAARLIL